MDSPASSTSSSSSPECLNPYKLCQICSQPAHGKHFGAISCRACSAFFRRAFIGNYDSLRCRLLDGKCEAKSNGRFGCQKCRLQKCYKAGMSVDQLQFDRDLVSSTEQFNKQRKQIKNIPHSPENFLGRPNFIFSCEPELATSNKTILDVQFLIDLAANIFSVNNEPRRNEQLIGMNTLDRLAYALGQARIPSNNTPIVCSRLGKDEHFMFWEYKVQAAAEWLTYCDEFQELPQDLKIKFLKGVWYIWMKYEKISKSAQKQLNFEAIETIYHVINNAYIDMENITFDSSWMSNYTPEQLHYFLESPNRMQQNHVVKLLLDLRVSHQEVTYFICVVAFRYTAKQNPGVLAELAERLIDKLADDLHNFYLNEWNLKNYAPRLAKLMKIVQYIENDIYERKQRSEIARVFDVFTIEFSHPEMFIGI